MMTGPSSAGLTDLADNEIAPDPQPAARSYQICHLRALCRPRQTHSPEASPVGTRQIAYGRQTQTMNSEPSRVVWSKRWIFLIPFQTRSAAQFIFQHIQEISVPSTSSTSIALSLSSSLTSPGLITIVWSPSDRISASLSFACCSSCRTWRQ